MITGRLGLRISHTRVGCLDAMSIVAMKRSEARTKQGDVTTKSIDYEKKQSNRLST